MSEAIRTCKRCGRKYTGWNCPNPACKAARAKRNASRRRSRAYHSGDRSRTRRYAAGSFSWAGSSVVGPIHADACPRQSHDEPEASGNYTRDEVDYMRHPD